MDSITNGFNHKWIQSQMNSITNEFNHKSIQSQSHQSINSKTIHHKMLKDDADGDGDDDDGDFDLPTPRRGWASLLKPTGDDRQPLQHQIAQATASCDQCRVFMSRAVSNRPCRFVPTSSHQINNNTNYNIKNSIKQDEHT